MNFRKNCTAANCSLFVLFLIFWMYGIGCKPNKDSLLEKEISWALEQHRPQFHFSPKTGWMNDPNGMVYFDGEYHLFYQYFPDSTVWGPMHWGHAVSEDLVHWEHLPIGLYPDSLGWIFSGSAVYDEFNSSGFGKDGKSPLVAIYTHHNAVMEQSGSNIFQYQSISYSLDKGRTWQSYEGNPVVKNPGIRDFRDPKVIWHEHSGQWIMALSALDHLMFYGSEDLKSWELLSEFGREIGSHDGVWECPDLFPLPDENGNEHWVLIENMNPGNPNGGSGTQYFIGNFDGKTFSVNPQFNQLLSPLSEFVPEGELFEDFESGLGKWESEGDAFAITPGSKGKGNMVSSIVANNAKKGMIASEEFIINHNAINFLIGGGNHRSKTLIGLEVDGRLVRESEGNMQEEMVWKGWDVSPYLGKTARLKIIDQYEGDWGFVEIDQITFADEVAHGEITGSVWLDAGADNYAGVTWANVPESDGRRIFIGWMSNWAYAQLVPTGSWRSAMTIPLELGVRNIGGIPRLTGYPVSELNKLRNGDIREIIANEKTKMPENGLADITLEFSKDENFRIELGNELGEYIAFEYNAEKNQFGFDRSNSGKVGFSPDFQKLHTVTRIAENNNITVRMLHDHSSIEIFIDEGLNIFSEIFFPNQIYNYIKVTEAEILNGQIERLASIWK